MADNFDERSGLVFSETPWGKWGQTIEDIHILIKVVKGTRAKAIKCNVEPGTIHISVAGQTILKVTCFELIANSYFEVLYSGPSFIFLTYT